jgi:hypothetical protein
MVCDFEFHYINRLQSISRIYFTFESLVSRAGETFGKALQQASFEDPF